MRQLLQRVELVKIAGTAAKVPLGVSASSEPVRRRAHGTSRPRRYDCRQRERPGQISQSSQRISACLGVTRRPPVEPSGSRLPTPCPEAVASASDLEAVVRGERPGGDGIAAGAPDGGCVQAAHLAPGRAPVALTRPHRRPHCGSEGRAPEGPCPTSMPCSAYARSWAQATSSPLTPGPRGKPRVSDSVVSLSPEAEGRPPF